MAADPASTGTASTDDAVKRRRRGAELERALLEAAWQELVEVGFAKLTMESVADRAQTGVAVLYRRWTNKTDLVIAAIRYSGEEHPIAIPDTGDLRTDMIQLLENVNAARAELTRGAMAMFVGLHDDAGLIPADVRQIIRGEGPGRAEEIFRRADQRGEIDLARIPRAVIDMPMELVRHDILMTLKPVPRERIRLIVDDLFLPLVLLGD